MSGGDLVGIVTSRDVRFENRLDALVRDVMTPKERLVTVKEGADKETVRELLHKHRIEKVLIVDDAFTLKGMMTVKDIEKAKADKAAATGHYYRLMIQHVKHVLGDIRRVYPKYEKGPGLQDRRLRLVPGLERHGGQRRVPGPREARRLR